jgi:rhodanese-related sulfurtransferase
MSILNAGPQEAHRILAADPAAVLLDVRSKMEFDYVGHPLGAINLPLMEPPHWQTDSEFVDKVRRALHARTRGLVEALTVMTLCRSGKRSLVAADLLAQAGFQQVYNILEGFEGELDANKHRNTLNGWRARGLPWEQG